MVTAARKPIKRSLIMVLGMVFATMLGLLVAAAPSDASYAASCRGQTFNVSHGDADGSYCTHLENSATGAVFERQREHGRVVTHVLGRFVTDQNGDKVVVFRVSKLLQLGVQGIHVAAGGEVAQFNLRVHR